DAAAAPDAVAAHDRPLTDKKQGNFAGFHEFGVFDGRAHVAEHQGHPVIFEIVAAQGSAPDVRVIQRLAAHRPDGGVTVADEPIAAQDDSGGRRFQLHAETVVLKARRLDDQIVDVVGYVEPFVAVHDGVSDDTKRIGAPDYGLLARMEHFDAADGRV